MMAKVINNHSDESILLLIQNKKEDGIKKLMERYFDELFRFAIKLTGNEEDVKDIIQTVFLNLWQFTQVDKIKNVKAYLFKMIKSEVYKLWAQRKNITELLEKYNEILIEAQDASSQIEFDELHNQVEVAISSLPHSCRQIFKLSKHGELSLDTIANQLNLSKQTVKNQLTKANSILRSQLESNGGMLI